MIDLSSKIACIVENGLFTSLAVTLAKSFKKLYYYSSWESPFPRSNALLIGKGLPEVTRIDSIWPVLDEVDIFIFPDIYHGPLQVMLQQRFGKRVWGSRLGENFEVLRGLSKRMIREAGLPVGPYRQIRGMDRLRDFLKKNEDQYVKISQTRGDMETFHAENYGLIEPRLNELEHALGAKAGSMDFMVESGIEAKAEVGYDGFTIDGRFPSNGLYGVESKDAAYLGEVTNYTDLPQAVKDVNGKLSMMLAKLGYRGFFSTEIRVGTDGKPYLIDPCCRMASPPGELYQYMISNLAEVIWAGSEGSVLEPEFTDKYGAELIIRSEWAQDNWQPIDYPDSIADNVKLHYWTRIDGRNYFVPQSIGMQEVGAVVATGSTVDEAIKNCRSIAKKVSGYSLKFNFEALDDAASDMRKLKRAA